jgi:hypothetical protein
MGKRGVVVGLAVFVTSMFGLPPADATHDQTAVFAGVISYTSKLTAVVTSRSATLTATMCTNEGGHTPFKGPLQIQVLPLPTCSLTVTVEFSVFGAECLPIGGPSARGSYTIGFLPATTWSLSGTAEFTGVGLVVEGTATLPWGIGAQTGPFTLVAAVVTNPFWPGNDCLTNAVSSAAVGEFHLDTT